MIAEEWKHNEAAKRSIGTRVISQTSQKLDDCKLFIYFFCFDQHCFAAPPGRSQSITRPDKLSFLNMPWGPPAEGAPGSRTTSTLDMKKQLQFIWAPSRSLHTISSLKQKPIPAAWNYFFLSIDYTGLVHMSSARPGALMLILLWFTCQSTVHLLSEDTETPSSWNTISIPLPREQSTVLWWWPMTSDWEALTLIPTVSHSTANTLNAWSVDANSAILSANSRAGTMESRYKVM